MSDSGPKPDLAAGSPVGHHGTGQEDLVRAHGPGGLVANLQSRNEALEGRLRRSEERLQQTRDALEKMRSLRDAMASRNKVAREQLTALQSSARETAGSLRAEKVGLRAEIRDLRATMVSLQGERNTLRREVTVSATRINALEKRLLRSEERLQQTKDALEKMRSLRDAMASRNKVAREQLTALQSSARETAGRLRAEKAGLREQVQAEKASSAPIRAERNALRQKTAALTKQVGALGGRLQRAEERLQQTRDALEKMRSSARETAERLRGEGAGLRERVQAEEATSASLLAENKALRKETAASAARVGALEAKLQRSEKQLQQSKDALEKLRDTTAEKHGNLVERLSLSRERTSSVTSLWTGARRYSALYRQGLLYDEIEKSDLDLSADTYLCLLPSSVPAAMTLNRMHGGGGRIICDSVENVEVHKHSLAPNLHPPTLEMVNLGAYGALTAVDGIMTVSNAVAKTLTRFGPPVRLQPNYRRYEEPSPAGNLRQRLGLDAESTILVTTGNVVKGFDTVIDAVALLPPSVHLVALVKMSPPSYDAEIRVYIESKGLSERVHLLSFVPYHELAGVLSDADLGLITLDPENPNHSVSLPNRVFDFTTAGLPFVVPPLAEIAAFVAEHRCGAVIPEVSAEAWAATIQDVLLNIPGYRDSMRRARRKVTWESLDDGLIDFLGNPESVTLLGFRDLSRYQRFLRVTDSLTQRGIHVKAAFFSEDPLPLKNKDAEFYHFADRYGRGSGLNRVPSSGD